MTSKKKEKNTFCYNINPMAKIPREEEKKINELEKKKKGNRIIVNFPGKIIQIQKISQVSLHCPKYYQ